MAITVTTTINKNHIFGDQRVMDCSFSINGTYVTGGFTISPNVVGLDVIDYVDAGVDASSGAGTAVAYLYGWNKSSGKMQLFVTASTPDGATGFAELTNGSTVTTAGFDALIYGVD
jgi:hypothetical protein